MTSIQSVSGPAVTESIRCADAHGHLWISKGVEQAPALDDERASLSELSSFAEAGGGLILDCQPGICGRDGSVLARLAASTTVTIVASTGFHLQKYYVGGTGPWSQSAEEAERVFRDELCHGLSEAPGVKAGSIKTAWGGTGGREDELLLAALDVAMSVGVGMTVHTEMGVGVERLATLIVDSGVAPNRVQLSHVDKRPDIGLHAELAHTGFVLGYDTFLRPKYEPETNVWPLIREMLERGLERNIAIGLDIVDGSMWQAAGGPGLRTIPGTIVPRLRREGASETAISAVTSGNICRVLGGEE